jgi:ion channel-forming bestrophin family protein
MYEARKETSRANRRVVFDQDYWANMRCTSRLFFSVINIPASRILLSVCAPVAFITGIACLTTIGLEIPQQFLPLPTWTHFFPVQTSSQPLLLTSSILALLLIFRTNSSARRFEEAAKLWSLLLSRSRDFLREAITFYPKSDIDGKATLARWTMVLAIALKCHLRPDEDLKEQAGTLLTQREMKLLKTADHPVCACGSWRRLQELVQHPCNAFLPHECCSCSAASCVHSG